MKIRALLSSTALCVVVACGSAAAADLPMRSAPPVYVPPPTFTWTGLYIGGFAGAHFDGHETVIDLTGLGQSPSFGKTGVTAGGLAGFNYQLGGGYGGVGGLGGIVVGIEGEVGYTDRSGSAAFINNAGLLSVASTAGDLEGRIRGRVGLATASFGFGSALFYVAGGASFLQDRLVLTDLVTGAVSPIRRDRIGYNIGGGVEVAFTPNWIARVEYIYDDYGTKAYPFRVVNPASEFGTRNVRITDMTARGAIEYKFDFAAPAAVVAKY